MVFRKGQMHLMEYVVMIFFIIFILVVLIFFLSGWTLTQSSLEKSSSESQEALGISKSILSDYLLIKEDSMLDDAKLTALADMDACKEFGLFYGGDWFAEVFLLGNEPKKECTTSEYPDCNYWSFCMKGQENASYILPVNIYRNIGMNVDGEIFGRVDIGFIRAGLYVES